MTDKYVGKSQENVFMSTSLFGRSPKNSFSELLKFDSLDSGVQSQLTRIVDGKGNPTPLQISSSAVAFNGAVWPSSVGAVGTVLSVGANNQLQWVPMTATSSNDKRYDLAFATNGTPVAGNIFLFTASRAFSLPAGLVGSVAGALQPPQYDANLSIFKKLSGGAASKVGSIKFSSGSTVGLFTTTGVINFAVGDMFYVKLDAADATLSDVAVTLVGILIS